MADQRKSKATARKSARRLPQGVIVRHLAGGDALTYRMRHEGRTLTKALDVPASASFAEIQSAADAARAALLRPTEGIGEYVEQYAVAKDLKPRSVVALRQALRGFGLDDDENSRAVAAIQSRKDYSQGTKRAYMQRISAFYRWIADQGIAVRNPCAGRKIPKASAPREYGFTAQDVSALLSATDADGDPEDRLFVRILRFTGARCSTAYALAPADFVATDTGYRVHLRNVKCNRDYSTPLAITDADTCELLRRHLARHTKRMWTASERGLHDRLLRRMKRVIGPTASPHGLRHFVACELLAKGVPLETISRILDHASIAITHQIYAKQPQTAIDDALGRLG
jgi:integrase